MFERMREEIARVKAEDPAAPSSAVVVLCYSGLHAIWNHRFEHWLWNRGHHSLARWLAGFTRHFTGVEIHPGAQIGRRVFIDHGMGIVIGETTIVGDGCTLYQGCTLGGTGKESGKRHPTLKENVTVGVGAAVLGNITIGANSKIGGGAVVVDDVPDDCTVVGIPGHVVRQGGKHVEAAHEEKRREELPDPVISLIEQLKRRVDLLDKRLEMLQCLPSGRLASFDLDGEQPELENRSLAAQLIADENRMREAVGRKALSEELQAYAARSTVEQAFVALPNVSDTDQAARLLMRTLGAKVEQLPADAPQESVAEAVASTLDELVAAIRVQAQPAAAATVESD